MTSIMSKSKKAYYKFGAALMVGINMGFAGDALAAAGTGAAGNTFSSISKNIVTSIQDLPGFLSAMGYMFGSLLGVLGVMKIKDHVENPTQTHLKDGAIRLAAGGALFALPMVMEAMLNTVGADGTAVKAAELNKVSFTTK